MGWGGQEIRTLTEAAGMIHRGHQVSLLCPPNAQIFAAAQTRNIPVQAANMGRKNLYGLWAVYKRLRQQPVDVVITHSSTDSWLTAVACQILSSPPPVIRLRHISAPVHNNFPSQWLYSKGCAHIITTGECIRTQLINNNGIAADHITSIPTGIDLDRFIPGNKKEVRQKLGLPESDHIIGIIATLRSWKGHLNLIEAFTQLQNPNGIHLLIVGDGPMRSTLEAMVEQYHLQEKVIFTGNQENTVPWFQAIDTFVLPSYANEGVPQALRQAMACELPVIGGNCGGIPETITDGKTGLLFTPKDIPALVSAIQKLMNDAKLAARMGSAARNAAQQQFTIKTMLDRMDTVINHVLKKP